ncbi:coat protein [ssRNA phage Gephyllon.3_2]|jgi:hypothetical protein|uniref:Coat protein n=2 Tax=Norzivirales TaxID=2842247 RepID=A0A8S5L3G2_9VIRU|nr:coat protein [ssRNA phage Gephyllon.3_2]QDH88462.1 MAG: hypothetical protein H4Bulk462064_000002 [Leviviridae sp.]QDH89888.1 MAG: hypothetical protein H3BulkLitter16284_000002 [Leviviridae sp.]DAD52224.1 TPA_asm: coat protein [ssRNA phage Gephyllon.3_2]
MTWSPSSPVTGGAQTGFTSPTYTLTTDIAPDVNGKQHAVTALGGTQTGVRSHSVSDPFTVTFMRPKNPRVLPNANPVTGKYSQIPRNTYAMIVRKGVNYAANQAPDVCVARLTIDVPAGSDNYDAANVRALCSIIAGILSQQSAGAGDSLVTGIL